MRWLTRCVLLPAFALALMSALIAPASANSKYAALVVHADSGDVLFNRYSTSRRYPASLTKMMTLYLVFEAMEAGKLSADTKMKISSRAAGQPPSKLGLKAGSTIDVESAINALVVKSANDVAVVVSEHLGGSEWRFAKTMTKKARSLGMSRTTFRNASGLPNSKQVTTAKDMSILARRLVQDFPQYFHYFSTKKFTWNGKTYTTHNSLVKNFDGADGIKTGYTRRSGFNLVTTVTRDGQRLIGVVLGGRSSYTRDKHMRQILSNAFTAIKKRPGLIASLHRNTPAPRLKPTSLALLEMEKEKAAPTLAGNTALRQEILTAASQLGEPADKTAQADPLSALIASMDTDDLNEYERVRLSALAPQDGFVGEGDREPVNELTWGVQIGAYSSTALAQKELKAAAAKGDMADRPRAVVPMTRNGETLFRARFIELSEIEATIACANLKAKNISCYVVSGDEDRGP